jgi:hypothetical protein
MVLPLFPQDRRVLKGAKEQVRNRNTYVKRTPSNPFLTVSHLLQSQAFAIRCGQI